MPNKGSSSDDLDDLDWYDLSTLNAYNLKIVIALTFWY